MRALYQIDIGGLSPANALRGDPEGHDLAPDLQAYADHLVNGIYSQRAAIDQLIAPLVTEWDFTRIAAVDRNLLRIAAYELFQVPSVPPAVTINEAIELAKKYSTAESGRFVNGVLGRLLIDSPKSQWDPATAPEEDWESPAPPEEEAAVEEVREGSPEVAELERIGLWRVKTPNGGDRD